MENKNIKALEERLIDELEERDEFTTCILLYWG